MAELADALGSGPSVRKDIGVQVSFRAIKKPCYEAWLFYCRHPYVIAARTARADRLTT